MPGKDVAAIARGMRITQLDGGATARWEPNHEQLSTWDAADDHRRRYITKSRRIGVSTALDFERCIWTTGCASFGHRVRAGIFIHVEDKVRERIAQCSAFLQQLGVAFTPKTFSIEFPGGSEIVGHTAGGDSASRSEGFQHATYEEYAFYKPGAYGEISPSIGKGAIETIATTIDVGASNGIKAREMWRTENGYHKMFFPFEHHKEYRADPMLISEERWAWAQAQGFTRRDSAAYWLTELLPNKCEGDVMRAFREYPPTEDKMFASSDSLWIARTPELAIPIDGFSVLGIRGDDWPVHVYRQPKDCVGKLLIGVDTAEGKGLDRSVAIVVDEVDWRPAAIMVSDRIVFDDLARVVLELQQRYTKNGVAPAAIIEEIGIGSATCTAAANLGVIFDRHTPSAENKYRGLLMSKMAVESGLLQGPMELTVECDELHRDAKTGEFKGRKDILMAYGMVAQRFEQAPWLKPKEIKKVEHVIDGAKMIRHAIRRERNQGWNR